MKTSFKSIALALVFAILIIASSYFLKGRAIADWVDAAIYGLGIYFVLRYFTRQKPPQKSCITK